jgi:hypothetical protein
MLGGDPSSRPTVIRTRLVELSTLEAVAYRLKLRGGKAVVAISL